MPNTLHFTADSGNSFKPALVLRQTGRFCTMKPINMLAGVSRQPAFLAINPLGQVPYLVTHDGRGLGESNAIAWLLAEHTPLMPSEPMTRAQAVQWMIFEQTALEPNISPARFIGHIVPALAREGGFDLERFAAVLRWMERVRKTPEYAEIADLLKP
jgi:glutathione S-transferase